MTESPMPMTAETEKRLRAELNDAQTVINLNKDINKNLKEQLAQAKADLTSKSSSLFACMADKDRLRREFNTLEDRATDLESALARARDTSHEETANRLVVQNTELRTVNASQATRLEEARINVAGLADENTALRTRINGLLEALDRSTSKFEAIRGERDREAAEVSSLEKMVEIAVEEGGVAAETIEDHAIKEEALLLLVRKRDERITALRGEVRRAKIDLADAHTSRRTPPGTRPMYPGRVRPAPRTETWTESAVNNALRDTANRGGADRPGQTSSPTPPENQAHPEPVGSAGLADFANQAAPAGIRPMDVNNIVGGPNEAELAKERAADAAERGRIFAEALNHPTVEAVREFGAVVDAAIESINEAIGGGGEIGPHVIGEDPEFTETSREVDHD